MRVKTIIERLDSFFLSFHRMGTMELGGGTNTGCGMPWTYTRTRARTRGFLCLYYNSIFDSV